MLNKRIATMVLFVMFVMLTPLYSSAALDVPVLDQDIITELTGYRYICGPTAASEVTLFWAKNGYPNLMSGQPNGEVPDMSKDTLDLWNIMRQYVKYDGSYTWEEPMRSGIQQYFYDRGYEADVILTRTGMVYWTDIVKELDAGRPLIMLAYNWNHWFVVTDYTIYPEKTLTVLWGHVPYVRVIKVADFTPSQCRAVYIRPKVIITPPPIEPPPPPVEITPYNETWYPEAKAWCDANGWGIVKLP